MGIVPVCRYDACFFGRTGHLVFGESKSFNPDILKNDMRL